MLSSFWNVSSNKTPAAMCALRRQQHCQHEAPRLLDGGA
jgi:hypothetical protein